MKINLMSIVALIFIHQTLSAESNFTSPVRGKIFRRNDDFYVAIKPRTLQPIYKIKWHNGFRTRNICFYDRSSHCPDYLVYFKDMRDSSTERLLIEATAERVNPKR